MIRRFAWRGLVALVAGSALYAVAIAPSQAQTSSTRCSLWKTDVSGLQYRECLVTQPSGSGVAIRTGLQVVNTTSADRYAGLVQRTIIGGRVKGTATCRPTTWQLLRPNAPATCWEPSPTTYRLVAWKSYGYGNGTLFDRDTHQSGETSSPLVDLRDGR